ncbi:MAG TPA: hypothetical protein VHG08_24680 [Longimicrobium sp.]|nr:hypothetical protein [Longimicrobium sp.]
MKHTLRSLSAAFAAALALACAAVGNGGTAARDDGPGVRAAREPASVAAVDRGLAAARLKGSRPALERIPRRSGTPPRAHPGSHLPTSSLSAAGPAPPGVLHPHASRALRPAFARHLAAARDGTLSALSAGVPPPLPA